MLSNTYLSILVGKISIVFLQIHLLHISVTAPVSSTLSGPTFLTSFHYNEGEEKTIELLFLARSRYPNVVCEYQMRLELLEAII